MKATTASTIPGITMPPKHDGDLPENKITSRDTKEENMPSSPSYFSSSKSKSTTLIAHSASIGSFTLVQNWDEKTSLNALTAAVNAVLEDNPILTGVASADMARNGFSVNEIRITPGAFIPTKHHTGSDVEGQSDDENSHCFVEQINTLRQHYKHTNKNKIPSIHNLVVSDDGLGQIKYIDKYVAPLVRDCTAKTTLEQIKDALPLFNVRVVLLPDDYAVININMSHSIGDLVTYIHILEQISLYDNSIVLQDENQAIDIDAIRSNTQRKTRRRHPKIDWTNPLIPSHEIYPDDVFSQQDYDRSYGLPFMLGVSSHFPTMPFRKQQYMTLSRANIKEKIKEIQMLKKQDHPVGANDIITAALCDINRSCDIFALTKSMRGITPGLHQNTGGNLHCEIPFQRIAGRNPYVIRDIIETGQYFDTDEMPLYSSIVGRIGRITNCATPSTTAISFGGHATKTICHFPPKQFLDSCPLDTAVIFTLNKNTFGVLHNFQDYQKPLKDSEANCKKRPFLYDLRV